MTVQTTQRSEKGQPFVSILVATLNRPDDLVPCLETLLAQEYANYEIVVLDQSLTSASQDAVRAAFGEPSQLRYLRTSNVGKSLALNTLLEASRGDLLAFTDDDTIAPTDWLTHIVQAFESDPEVGIVFGQVIAGDINEATGEVITPAFYFNERRFLARGETAGMGANMALRRASAAFGIRFDTQLGPGTPIPAAEEGDFIYRVQRAGVKILLDPSVKLIHRAARSVERWRGVLFGYGQGDAAFAMKHLRCGDMKMLFKIIKGAGYIGARGCLRVVQRRPHDEFFYVRGYMKGIRDSLKLRVDKQTRLYIPPNNDVSGNDDLSDEEKAAWSAITRRPESNAPTDAPEGAR